MISTKGVIRIMCLVLLPAITKAQSNIDRDSVFMGDYSLVYTANTHFDADVHEALVNTFFTVYPKLVARFNKNAPKTVYFEIDVNNTAIAYTYNKNQISFNPNWFGLYPKDIDIVTHEGMHVVQGYPSFEPSWLSEGIADYVRYTYGVGNQAADWSMPELDNTQHYTQSYRVAARFLVWLEKHKRKDMVDKLDAAMRAGTYTPDLWKRLTGKNVDELWQEYAANPTI